MDKARIFIASSGRTLVLAEKLRDELSTPFSEARLWSEEGRLQPGATIIEMLEGAARTYDFAAIILSRDDVISRGEREALKARDNCVFEAGLFMKALGRDRCFLINSVSQTELPSDLGGVISIPFVEPRNLEDRSECAGAILQAAAQIKDSMQQGGPSPSHECVPVLSAEEVFRRERPRAKGGELELGRVVVVDTQPMADLQRARLLRRNMDEGTSYHLFYGFSEDTIEKLCQALQMVAWAGTDDEAEQGDFRSRIVAITHHKDEVLKDLRDVCRGGLLRFTLLNEPSSFSLRVHNADNPTLARLYGKYHEKGYIVWAERDEAVHLWRKLPVYVEEDTGDRLYVPLKRPGLDSDQQQRLVRSFDRWLGRYFRGIETEMKELCLGGMTTS